MKLYLSAALLAFVLLGAAPGADPAGTHLAAQSHETPDLDLTPQQRSEAERAIGRIKSPWCPGRMLEVCPSPQAGELRDSIRAVAALGVEGDSIVEMMLARVGEEWRAYPRSGSEGVLAWWIPPMVLLFGLGMVAVVLRRLRAKNPEVLPELTEDQERQVQEVLERLEQAEREAAEVY